MSKYLITSCDECELDNGSWDFTEDYCDALLFRDGCRDEKIISVLKEENIIPMDIDDSKIVVHRFDDGSMRICESANDRPICSLYLVITADIQRKINKFRQLLSKAQDLRSEILSDIEEAAGIVFDADAYCNIESEYIWCCDIDDDQLDEEVANLKMHR